MMYYSVSVLFLLFKVVSLQGDNVSVQYNGGILPDIILLTKRCYHNNSGTLLNGMKRFCLCSL